MHQSPTSSRILGILSALFLFHSNEALDFVPNGARSKRIFNVTRGLQKFGPSYQKTRTIHSIGKQHAHGWFMQIKGYASLKLQDCSNNSANSIAQFQNLFQKPLNK